MLRGENHQIFLSSVIGLIGLSSVTTDQIRSEGYSDSEVWRHCIHDIQDNIIHTMSDIIKVTFVSYQLLTTFSFIFTG